MLGVEEGSGKGVMEGILIGDAVDDGVITGSMVDEGPGTGLPGDWQAARKIIKRRMNMKGFGRSVIRDNPTYNDYIFIAL